METTAIDVATAASAGIEAGAKAGRTGTVSPDEGSSASASAASTAQPSHVSYGSTFAGFSPDEMRAIAEVKRFYECYMGDRDFREAVDAGEGFTSQQRRMLKDIGVTFEPEAMELVWLRPEMLSRFPLMVEQHPSFEDLPSDIHALLAPYPELRVWLRWRHRVDRMNLSQKMMVSSRATLSPEYDAWRSRRIRAVRNELGAFGWTLDHPCYAVEMAVGCSVQCNFCAFDAGKLETVFDLSRPENRESVRAVAAGMLKVLGWPATHGMLYWCTEPHDNPDYVRLLAFWQKLTGAMLCTATARAGEDWVRDLINFYTKGPVPWPRISVLSRGMMRRLHKAFTPIELRDTTLLMQQKDVEELRGKVPGGRERMLRQLVEADDLRNVDIENLPDGFEPPQGSIACISGTLVNMVERTVRLISPCYTTMEHRYGYRVFDETTFDDHPQGFEVALKRMIRRSMATGAYPEMPVRWRDDLKAVRQPDGFTLLSPTTRVDFRQGDMHLRAAELVGRGDLTYGQVLDALSASPGVGPFTAMALLDLLFKSGYLCELTITRDYRARREAEEASLREPIPAAA